MGARLFVDGADELLEGIGGDGALLAGLGAVLQIGLIEHVAGVERAPCVEPHDAVLALIEVSAAQHRYQPPLMGVHGQGFLCVERRRARHLAVLELRDVVGQQIVEHGADAASVDLLIEWVEVVHVVADHGVGHVNDQIATLIRGGRNNPIVIRCHHHVAHIGRNNHVLVLALDRQEALCDQRLQDFLMLPVSGEKRLIDKQKDCVAQMGVELAYQVFAVGDGQAVLAEHAKEIFASVPLPQPFFPRMTMATSPEGAAAEPYGQSSP